MEIQFKYFGGVLSEGSIDGKNYGGSYEKDG